MQPDPDLFLSGARRSLLKILERGEIADPVTRLTLERIAETLAHLALRETELPAIVAPLLEDQRRLLGPAEVRSEEGPLAAFDRASRVLARRAETVSRQDTPEAEAFLRDAGAAEGKLRAGYKTALADLKARDQSRAPTNDDLGRVAPTPEAIAAYLQTKVAGAANVQVTNLRQLIAVNSKDIIFFDVAGVPGWPVGVVFRRLRGFSVNDLASMPYEANILRVMGAAGIPGPRPLLVDEAGGPFGEPFMIMERIPGRTESPASLGGDGRVAALDIARTLAAIHRVDPALVGRPEELALAPRERMLDHVERHYRIWQANQAEPSVTVEAAYGWIRRNVGVLSDATVLVHGDFDLRNLLIEGGRLSGVLDWERSHVGHPAQDLAYLRKDIEALVPWDEFLAAYRAAGGFEVDEAMLEYFQVWGYVFRTTIASRAHNGYATGEHDDFLVGSVGFIEYHSYLDTLRELIG